MKAANGSAPPTTATRPARFQRHARRATGREGPQAARKCTDESLHGRARGAEQRREQKVASHWRSTSQVRPLAGEGKQHATSSACSHANVRCCTAQRREGAHPTGIKRRHPRGQAPSAVTTARAVQPASTRAGGSSSETRNAACAPRECTLRCRATAARCTQSAFRRAPRHQLVPPAARAAPGRPGTALQRHRVGERERARR